MCAFSAGVCLGDPETHREREREIEGKRGREREQVRWEPSVKCFNCDANAETNEVIMSENKRKVGGRREGDREGESVREWVLGSHVMAAKWRQSSSSFYLSFVLPSIENGKWLMKT